MMIGLFFKAYVDTLDLFLKCDTFNGTLLFIRFLETGLKTYRKVSRKLRHRKCVKLPYLKIRIVLFCDQSFEIRDFFFTYEAF